MGMSTHILAFTPDTDAEYQKHKKVLLACRDADVSLPKETEGYFGSNDTSDETLEERLRVPLEVGIDYIKYTTEDSEGYEVDLTRLPKGVTKIRFYNNNNNNNNKTF